MTVPAYPTDGTYHQISVLIYDDTNSMIVHRTPWTYCHLYLQTPKSYDPIDKIGEATFSLLDVGDSTATERSLMAEGKNVVIITGNTVTFSGKIRRCAQNLQSGFSTTTRVKLWDVECDTDLAKLQNTDVDSSVLSTYGSTLYGSPGDIARILLTPATGVRDTRGVINVVDTVISYQLNSSTVAESAGNQYDHLMALRDSTNYDLRSRPEFLMVPYDSFDGATVMTFTLGAFTTDEFLGAYALFLGTTNTGGVVTYGKITGNDATTITCAAMVNAAAAPTATANVIIYRGYLVDFAQDLSQPSVIKNFDINKDVFEFKDNDDKRKLSTKIVATGKDLQGKTISVSLAAVHAYDDATQYFEDATFIRAPSEGYIYQNSSVSVTKSVTAYLEDSKTYSTSYGTGDVYSFFIARPNANYHVGQRVILSGGTAPGGFVNGTTYYVATKVDTGSNIALGLSATRGGALKAMSSDKSGTVYISCYAAMGVDNSDGLLTDSTPIIFYGTTMPTGGTGLVAGTVYTCVNPIASSGSCFDVQLSGVFQNWATAGSGLGVYRTADIINPGTAGTPVLRLYGWGYEMLTTMTFAMVVPYGTTHPVTISDTGTETIATDGSLITEFGIAQLPIGSDTDFSGRGYLVSNQFWVDDDSLYTSGTIDMMVGEELVPITGSGTDTVHGHYFTCDVTLRIMSASLKSYPHGVGALVALNNYTEASPQTGSAIELYGLYIDNRTVDANITYGQLDAYVTNLLLGLGNFYKKAKTWGPMTTVYVPHVGEIYEGVTGTSLQLPPRPADRVSFTEYTGATPVEYQIVAVTIDHDRMTVELECGDFEKNVFTSLQQSTNALNRTLT